MTSLPQNSSSVFVSSFSSFIIGTFVTLLTFACSYTEANSTACSSSSSHRRLSGNNLGNEGGGSGGILCETFVPNLPYPVIYGIFVGAGFILTIIIFAIWYYRGYKERMERNRRRMSSFINPNTTSSSSSSSSTFTSSTVGVTNIKGTEVAKLSYNLTQYDDKSKDSANPSLADVYAINDIDDLFLNYPSVPVVPSSSSSSSTDTSTTTTSTTSRLSRSQAVALASRISEAPIIAPST